MFYLLLCLLALLSAAFVLLPLLRGPSQDDIDRNDINLTLYRQRLGELDEDLALDESQKQQLADEASRDLLGDTSSLSSIESPVKPASSSRKIVLAAALLVPVLAFFFYLDTGMGRGYFPDHMLSGSLKNLDPADQQGFLDVVDELADRAARRPDNVELQFLLANMLTNAGRYLEALPVFERLVAQFPEEPDLAARYAEALFLADDRTWTKRVSEAVDRASSLNPHNLTILEIRAIGAINGNRPEEALQWFARAKATGVTGRRAQLIETAIQGLEAKLGVTASVSEPVVMRELKVHVSMDKGVVLPPDTSVFVYARASEGPPAPLAVQRISVADLPMTVTLDESMAMMPAMSLAKFERVQVIARASRSGQVQPMPGDYEMRSEVLDFSEGDRKSLSLVIAERLGDQ